MKQILLVDADSYAASLYGQALKKAGYMVTVATSAQTAIMACESRTPDCIVLELQLQGHGGVEFLQELRSYTEWADIPVIVHTMVDQATLAKYDVAFKTYGIVASAYKPSTTLAQLVGMVSDVCKVSV